LPGTGAGGAHNLDVGALHFARMFTAILEKRLLTQESLRFQAIARRKKRFAATLVTGDSLR
jgi:hypothetical protein